MKIFTRYYSQLQPGISHKRPLRLYLRIDKYCLEAMFMVGKLGCFTCYINKVFMPVPQKTSGQHID